MVRARKTEPTATEESPMTNTDHPLDLTAFTVAKSNGLNSTVRTRESGVNPLAGYVARTLDEGPLLVPVQSEAQAKAATNYLRRDAAAHDLGVRIQYQDGNGVTVARDQAREVHFLAKREKSKRKYTNADILAWAVDNGWGEVSGPVPEELRNQFKAANGYA